MPKNLNFQKRNMACLLANQIAYIFQVQERKTLQFFLNATKFELWSQKRGTFDIWRFFYKSLLGNFHAANEFVRVKETFE